MGFERTSRPIPDIVAWRPEHIHNREGKELKMNKHVARWTGAIAAALLALGTQAALAQPAGGMNGHGRGLQIERILMSVKGQLELNTSQQVMWDNAIAQTKSARGAGRAGMEQVRAALNAELAKAEPDFAAVAATADAVQAGNQALRKQVRDEWLKLYATFTPAQKAVVRDNVKVRVARREAFRERMKEHWQSRVPAGGS
jgi:Spy/CpxP family protein refolding chaperone